MAAALAVLALFSDLDQLGILELRSRFNKSAPPLRGVAVTLMETGEGNPVADITVRNVSEEPVVISEARVVVDRVLRLRACSDTPLSSLAPTGTYDIAVPFAEGAVSKTVSRLVLPKTADRFQLVIAPAEADALYLVTLLLFYNESRSSLDLGKVLLFVDDHLVTDVPERRGVSVVDSECAQANLASAREFFQSPAARSERAADLERRVHAYSRQGSLLPPSPESGSPPSRAVPLPEAEVPLPVLDAARLFSVLLFVGQPVGKQPVCHGGIFNKDRVLTVGHCLVNRRTGKSRGLAEIVVVRVADLTEHSVTEVFRDPKPERDLVMLKVSPPFTLQGPTPLSQLLKSRDGS